MLRQKQRKQQLSPQQQATAPPKRTRTKRTKLARKLSTVAINVDTTSPTNTPPPLTTTSQNKSSSASEPTPADKTPSSFSKSKQEQTEEPSAQSDTLPPWWGIPAPPPVKRTSHAYYDYSFNMNDPLERTKTLFDNSTLSPSEIRHRDRQRRLLSKLHIPEVRQSINPRTIDQHRLIEHEFAAGIANGTVKLYFSKETLRRRRRKGDLSLPAAPADAHAGTQALIKEAIAQTLNEEQSSETETEEAADSVHDPLTSPSSKRKSKKSQQSFTLRINGETREFRDLNEWPLAEFPNGHTEPALYGPKHHIKPGWNRPAPFEFRQLRDTDALASWSQMRPIFRGQPVQFMIPGPGPLASEDDKKLWKNEIIDLKWFYRLWDPRYVSPDPTTMAKEGNYPMIYAFNTIPTVGQLSHPDYHKFVSWPFWPEYRENRYQAVKNYERLSREKPLEYIIASGAVLGLNAGYFVVQAITRFFGAVHKVFIPGRVASTMRKVGSGISHELKHFGHGFGKLMANVSASCKMLTKSTFDKVPLFRSERRMISRSFMDMLRLIPLIIIVAIPFLEFALPILLKIFPNMLPSTFADKKLAKTKAFTEYKTRLQLASYLERTLVRTVMRQLHNHSGIIQDTILDPTMKARFQTLIQQQKAQNAQNVQGAMNNPISESTTDADQSTTEFEHRPRTDDIDNLSYSMVSHETPPIATLMKEMFERLENGEDIESPKLQPLVSFFNKTLTVETLHQPQLEALCRFFDFPCQGDSNTLRNSISNGMAEIRRDDFAIRAEGVQKMSIPELQLACGRRGMRYNGVNKRTMRKHLNNWLNLSLDANLSSCLLIISRTAVMLDEIQVDPRFTRLRSDFNALEKKKAEMEKKHETVQLVSQAARLELERHTAMAQAATEAAQAAKRLVLDLQSNPEKASAILEQAKTKASLSPGEASQTTMQLLKSKQQQRTLEKEGKKKPEPFSEQESSESSEAAERRTNLDAVLRVAEVPEGHQAGMGLGQEQQQQQPQNDREQQATTRNETQSAQQESETKTTSATTATAQTTAQSSTPQKETQTPQQQVQSQSKSQSQSQSQSKSQAQVQEPHQPQAQVQAHRIITSQHQAEADLFTDLAKNPLGTKLHSPTSEMLLSQEEIDYHASLAARDAQTPGFGRSQRSHSRSRGSDDGVDSSTTDSEGERRKDVKLEELKRTALRKLKSDARARGEIVPDTSYSEDDDSATTVDDSQSSSEMRQSDDELAAEISKQLELEGLDRLTARDIELMKRQKKFQLASQLEAVMEEHETTSESEAVKLRSDDEGVFVQNFQGEFIPAQDIDLLLGQVVQAADRHESERESELDDLEEEAEDRAEDVLKTAQASVEQKKLAMMAVQEANKALAAATVVAESLLAQQQLGQTRSLEVKLAEAAATEPILVPGPAGNVLEQQQKEKPQVVGNKIVPPVNPKM